MTELREKLKNAEAEVRRLQAEIESARRECAEGRHVFPEERDRCMHCRYYAQSLADRSAPFPPKGEVK